MKAKFVFENISFERGKEPKDSIGIGQATVETEFGNIFRGPRSNYEKAKSLVLDMEYEVNQYEDEIHQEQTFHYFADLLYDIGYEEIEEEAQHIIENVGFTRGGSDQEIKDKILGRIPRGGLYLTTGKFPYLFMLIGEEFDGHYSKRAKFAHVGSFQGGGGRKTIFRFTANHPEYEWSFETLIPLDKVRLRQLELIKDAVWTDSDGMDSWDRIEEGTGIKPIRPVYESIRFERGASDDDIKRELRAGGSFQPGEILIHDTNRPYTKPLWVYMYYEPKNRFAPHASYQFGSIDTATGKAIFIHNTQNKTGMAGLQDNHLLRRATREEAKEIRKALRSGKYDRYIEECKKKTGLTPFV